MSTEIDICNIALSRIGARSIQNFTENLKEAKTCKIHYEHARDAVLEDYNWNFARKRLVLSLLPDTYSGWTYAYTYPSDCLTPREIYDQYGSGTNNGTTSDLDEVEPAFGKIQYEVATNAALDRQIILSNQEAAELIYTAKVTDTNIFTPMFKEALAWRIAMDIVVPIKGKPQLVQALAQAYGSLIGRASAADARKGYKKPTNDNAFTRARL